MEKSPNITDVFLWRFLHELRRRNVAIRYSISDLEWNVPPIRVHDGRQPSGYYKAFEMPPLIAKYTVHLQTYVAQWKNFLIRDTREGPIKLRSAAVVRASTNPNGYGLRPVTMKGTYSPAKAIQAEY